MTKSDNIFEEPSRILGFHSGSDGKESAYNVGEPGFDQEDPLEEGMVTHSSILAW